MSAPSTPQSSRSRSASVSPSPRHSPRQANRRDAEEAHKQLSVVLEDHIHEVVEDEERDSCMLCAVAPAGVTDLQKWEDLESYVREFFEIPSSGKDKVAKIEMSAQLHGGNLCAAMPTARSRADPRAPV